MTVLDEQQVNKCLHGKFSLLDRRRSQQRKTRICMKIRYFAKYPGKSTPDALIQNIRTN